MKNTDPVFSKIIPVFQTSDGQVWPDRLDARFHQDKIDLKASILAITQKKNQPVDRDTRIAAEFIVKHVTVLKELLTQVETPAA